MFSFVTIISFFSFVKFHVIAILYKFYGPQIKLLVVFVVVVVVVISVSLEFQKAVKCNVRCFTKWVSLVCYCSPFYGEQDVIPGRITAKISQCNKTK